ncbi:MAG: saccharopine dehydrogenase family protein [Anaerolineae bacterium]
MTDDWLIYGAYGYTGKLVVEEAVRRGHQPLLAGRNASKLASLAEQHNLDWMALDLQDAAAMAKALSSVDLVFHAAGPFVDTSYPMIQACLAGKTHYVDITGEIPVFENIFRYDERARDRGIALMPGVGFDVVPTDCMARYVAEQLPGATRLELAFAGMSKTSAGTAKTMLELMPTLKKGSLARRDGHYVHRPLGEGTRKVRFADGRTRTVVPIPWGDLATAFRSTRIPNITTYMAMRISPDAIRAARFIQKLMALKLIRKLAQNFVIRTVKGPTAHTRELARSYVWARVEDDSGHSVEAWLDTTEGYRFTAVAGVRSVEKLLELRPAGAFTPAQLFGPDFVLEIETTRRYDALPE